MLCRFNSTPFIDNKYGYKCKPICLACAGKVKISEFFDNTITVHKLINEIQNQYNELTTFSLWSATNFTAGIIKVRPEGQNRHALKFPLA